MDGGHPTNRSINRTYQHISTTSNYSSTTTTQHHHNQSSENSKSRTLLKQVPRGPAPFASFDSIASIDVASPEDRKTPTYQGKFILKPNSTHKSRIRKSNNLLRNQHNFKSHKFG